MLENQNGDSWTTNRTLNLSPTKIELTSPISESHDTFLYVRRDFSNRIPPPKCRQSEKAYWTTTWHSPPGTGGVSAPSAQTGWSIRCPLAPPPYGKTRPPRLRPFWESLDWA